MKDTISLPELFKVPPFTPKLEFFSRCTYLVAQNGGFGTGSECIETEPGPKITYCCDKYSPGSEIPQCNF